MPRKKDNPINQEEYPLMGIEYFQHKKEIKLLEDRNKELRTPLEALLTEKGDVSDKGNRQLVLHHADKDVVLNHTRRVSQVLLPEAVDVLKANGLEECIEEIPYVREDVLEVMYQEGKVSDEILKKIYAPKESFAFSVDVKNHETEA